MAIEPVIKNIYGIGENASPSIKEITKRMIPNATLNKEVIFKIRLLRAHTIALTSV